MADLSPADVARVRALVERADEQADEGEFEAALDLFEQALELLPEPWSAHAQAQTLLFSIADMQFLLEDFEASGDTYSALLASFESARAEPLPQLRLGQCLLEQGREAEALPHLQAVLKSAGEQAFRYEDPKYLEMARRA